MFEHLDGEERGNRQQVGRRNRGGTPVVLAMTAVALIAAGQGLAASAEKGTAERVNAVLKGRTFKELIKPGAADMSLKPEECAEARKAVWAAYREECLKDTKRAEEMRTKTVRGPSVMRFEYSKVGDKPASGYPLYIALHGGGGAPAEVNDGGWRHMQIYYLPGVKQGIYLAPRGVSDTWDLHFQGSSYPLYDRLIENMILFEDADPDRVYLLGYSAGGDGVYQIAPRMADRFAAADMSAGHHNGASALNLYNLPFLVQGGEKDAAYGRNRSFADYAGRLDKLAAEHPGGYVHDIFIHTDRGHGVPDNDPRMTPYDVLADPAAWLKDATSRATRKTNTNAIAWLDRFSRNPRPAAILWEVGMRADRSGKGPDDSQLWLNHNRGWQFYWLDLSGNPEKGGKTGRITAKLDRGRNAVSVETDGEHVGLLLNGEMLNLAKEVAVEIGGQTIRGRARPNLQNLVTTVADRGDPSYMFEARITLEKIAGKWAAR